MSQTLVKYPGEVRTYTFDFSGLLPVNMPRGTTWSAAVLGAGETFGSPLSLPLLLESMIQTTSPPAVTVTRSDGLAPDLTVGTPSPGGTSVNVQLGGGTDGILYTVTVLVGPTSQGNVLALQGRLQVSAQLP